MNGTVPGFVPKVLTYASIRLFRADERVFEAMVDGSTHALLDGGEGFCQRST